MMQGNKAILLCALGVVTAGGALASGCAAGANSIDEAEEIVGNLRRAGFPGDDISIVDGAVYVGRDAAVSLAASREMLLPDSGGREQYRTNSQIASTVVKICIDGPAFVGAFGTALDLAIENYE